ncbi:hypothetical protein [Spirillospora sp. NBC_01491]|uniref:hypothetical protein n=1 Tax=Spirillospora sp. NBC_01491 TaxID=2976007 RepID=UPI002E319F59|nr:hypothetical protein [Spirillospora sp. NBC_01491]
MEPTSAILLILTGLLATAAFAAAMLLWPRFAGSGRGPVLRRAGLLLASQATLTALIVLTANKYFVFYATWDDLLGDGTAKVQVKQVQSSHGAKADPSGQVRRFSTGLGPSRAGHPQDPAKDGRVDRLEVHGPRSGLDSVVYVYLPPQYFQPEYARKRLPVAMLLSGGPSDGPTAWIKQAHVPAEAAREVAAGRSQPMVYAMVRSAHGLSPAPPAPAPSGPSAPPGPGAHRRVVKGMAAGLGKTVKAGEGKTRDGKTRDGKTGVRPSVCVDLPGRAGGQAETFYTQDLPVALLSTYRLPRVRQGWGVAGFGTSGQCGTRFAMLHSDRFAAGASIDGALGAPPTAPGTAQPDPYGGSSVYRQDNDLLWRLEHLPPPPVSLLIATGRDGGEAATAARFASLAKPPARAEVSLVDGEPGTLGQWRGHLPSVLGWLSARLRGE